MCECEDNPPACGSKSVRKAAKDHRCYECSGQIRKGDLYTVHTGVWDGVAQSFKWCDTCSTIANLITELDDEFCFCFGGLIEAVEESMREAMVFQTPEHHGLTTEATAWS